MVRVIEAALTIIVVLLMAFTLYKIIKKPLFRQAKHGVLHKAFGEEKLICDWARDSRCVVCQDLLSRRVNKRNWDVEKALTTLTYGDK